VVVVRPYNAAERRIITRQYNVNPDRWDHILKIQNMERNRSPRTGHSGKAPFTTKQSDVEDLFIQFGLTLADGAGIVYEADKSRIIATLEAKEFPRFENILGKARQMPYPGQ